MRVPRFIVSLAESLCDPSEAEPLQLLTETPLTGLSENGTVEKCVSKEKGIFRQSPRGAIGRILFLNPAESHHLIAVLRKQPGDEIEVLDHDSDEVFSCVVLGGNPSKAYARILFKRPVPSALSRHRLVLIAGISRTQVSDMIAEKCVEIGVSELHFFQAERSQGQKKRIAERKARWERLLTAAQKQSGALSGVTIETHANLLEALTSLHGDSTRNVLQHEELGLSSSNEWRIIFLPSQTTAQGLNIQPPKITSLFRDSFDLAKSLQQKSETELENIRENVDSYLLVGPEGGFSAKESESALSFGYIAASLGANTLRCETAVIMACGLIQLWRTP